MSKVINIFDKRVDKVEDKQELSEIDIDLALEEAVKRNDENKERLRKERIINNKGVLKRFRIKN